MVGINHQHKKSRHGRSNGSLGVTSMMLVNDTTKIVDSKDIEKVLDYFRYKVGTSLDVAIATGVLRNSVTWYVSELEELGALQVVCVKPDSTTGYKAKHYSANPKLWTRQENRELSLFNFDKDEL